MPSSSREKNGLLISGMTTPMDVEVEVLSERAVLLGT